MGETIQRDILGAESRAKAEREQLEGIQAQAAEKRAFWMAPFRGLAKYAGEALETATELATPRDVGPTDIPERMETIANIGPGQEVVGSIANYKRQRFEEAKAALAAETAAEGHAFEQRKANAPKYRQAIFSQLTGSGVDAKVAAEKAEKLTQAWVARDVKRDVAAQGEAPGTSKAWGVVEGALSAGGLAVPFLRAGQFAAAAATAGAPISDALAEAFNVNEAGAKHQAAIEREAAELSKEHPVLGGLAGIGAGTTKAIRAIPGVGYPLAAGLEAIAGGAGRMVGSAVDPEAGGYARMGARMPAEEVGKLVSPDDQLAAAGMSIALNMADVPGVALAGKLPALAKGAKGLLARGKKAEAAAPGLADLAEATGRLAPEEALAGEVAAAKSRVMEASKEAGANLHRMDEDAAARILESDSLLPGARAKAEKAERVAQKARESYGKILLGEDGANEALDPKFKASADLAKKAVDDAEKKAAAAKKLADELENLAAKRQLAEAVKAQAIDTGRMDLETAGAVREPTPEGLVVGANAADALRPMPGARPPQPGLGVPPSPAEALDARVRAQQAEAEALQAAAGAPAEIGRATPGSVTPAATETTGAIVGDPTLPSRGNYGPGVHALRQRNLPGSMGALPDVETPAVLADRFVDERARAAARAADPKIVPDDYVTNPSARAPSVDPATVVSPEPIRLTSKDGDGHRLAATFDQLSYSVSGAADEAGTATQVAGARLEPKEFMPKLVSPAVKQAGEARLAGKLSDDAVEELAAQLDPEDALDLEEQIRSADRIKAGWRPGPEELGPLRTEDDILERGGDTSIPTVDLGPEPRAAKGVTKAERRTGLASTQEQRLAKSEDALRKAASRKAQLDDVAEAMRQLNEAKARAARMDSKAAVETLLARAVGKDKLLPLLAGATLAWEYAEGKDADGHDATGMSVQQAGMGAAGLLALLGIRSRPLAATADELAIVDRVAENAKRAGIDFNADVLAKWMKTKAPNANDAQIQRTARLILERAGITADGQRVPLNAKGGPTFAARVANQAMDHHRALVDFIADEGVRVLDGDLPLPTLESSRIGMAQHADDAERPFYLDWLPKTDRQRTAEFLADIQATGRADLDKLAKANLGTSGGKGFFSFLTAMYTGLNKLRIGHHVTASAERAQRGSELWNAWLARGSAAMPEGSAQRLVEFPGFARLVKDVEDAGVAWPDWVKYYRDYDNPASRVNKLNAKQRAAMEAANPKLIQLRDSWDAANKIYHDIAKPTQPYRKGYMMTAYERRDQLLDQLRARHADFVKERNHSAADEVMEAIHRIEGGGSPGEWMPDNLLSRVRKIPKSPSDMKRSLYLDGVVHESPATYVEHIGDTLKRRMFQLEFEPQAHRIRQALYASVNKPVELQAGGLARLTRENAEGISLYIDNALGVLPRKSVFDSFPRFREVFTDDARRHAAQSLGKLAAIAYLARPKFLVANRLSALVKGAPRMGFLAWWQAELAQATTELATVSGSDWIADRTMRLIGGLGLEDSKRIMKLRSDLGVDLTESQVSGHLKGVLDLPPTTAAEWVVHKGKNILRRVGDPLAYSELNIKGIMAAYRAAQVEDGARWAGSKLLKDKRLQAAYAKDPELAARMLASGEYGKIPDKLLISDTRFTAERQVGYWLDAAAAEARQAGAARKAALMEGRRMYSDLFHEYGTLARGGATMQNKSFDMAARMQTYLAKEIGYIRTLPTAAKGKYLATGLALGGPMAIGPFALLANMNEDVRDWFAEARDGKHGLHLALLLRANIHDLLNQAGVKPGEWSKDSMYPGFSPTQIAYPGMDFPRGFESNKLATASYLAGLAGGIPGSLITEPALRLIDQVSAKGAKAGAAEWARNIAGKGVPFRAAADLMGAWKNHETVPGDPVRTWLPDVMRVFASSPAEKAKSDRLSSELGDAKALSERVRGITDAVWKEAVTNGTVDLLIDASAAQIEGGLTGIDPRGVERVMLAGRQGPLVAATSTLPLHPATMPAFEGLVNGVIDLAAEGETSVRGAAPAVVATAHSKLMNARMNLRAQMLSATTPEHKAMLAAYDQELQRATNNLRQQAQALRLPLKMDLRGRLPRFHQLIASIPDEQAQSEPMLKAAVEEAIWKMPPNMDKAAFSAIASSWAVPSLRSAVDGPFIRTRRNLKAGTK